MNYRVVYPEIFYRVQPYIMNVCDQMDAAGFSTPTQEFMEKMSDSIYDDISRMYPDMIEYAKGCEKRASADPPARDVINDFDPFRRDFRRRGLLRDLIDILLLSEFHRRRRRNY